MECPKCGETLDEILPSDDDPQLIPGFACPAPACGYVGDGTIPPPEDDTPGTP